ncbi:type II toxin-antitoxin system HipA family toxin [Thalassospira sp.]|uniref:type II toxin-antitoxin system HipA family toxin n=1 Tax=Thalassospira sp. TaxID=1912094 RepID=UPI003AA87EC0
MTVLLNGRLVGTFHMKSNGAISFQYDQDWLNWEHAMPISLSLPLTETAYKGAAIFSYLENLLPDNQVIRDRVAAKVGAAGTDAYNMLEKIGKDCVGALQFIADYKGGQEKNELTGEPLTDAEIADILNNLASAPLGIEKDGDFRISIAGAQEKTALLYHEGHWKRPTGTTPTTHMLKTQLGTLPNGINLRDSVENEFFCMRFCKAMGANVADVEIRDFAETRALVIARFDRKWGRSGNLLRLPQEDFCQAMGYPPSLKYQSDGGPTVPDCIKLLDGSDSPTEDQSAFFFAQILFWLIGATDGHAKNFSIFLRTGGGFKMTPLYDVLSAQKAVDDGQVRLGQMRLAMSLGEKNHYRVDEIARRHFIQSARQCGFGVELVQELLVRAYERVPEALDKTEGQLPDDFPQGLLSSLKKGIESRRNFLGMALDAVSG